MFIFTTVSIADDLLGREELLHREQVHQPDRQLCQSNNSEQAERHESQSSSIRDNCRSRAYRPKARVSQGPCPLVELDGGDIATTQEEVIYNSNYIGVLSRFRLVQAVQTLFR